MIIIKILSTDFYLILALKHAPNKKKYQILVDKIQVEGF